MMAQSLSPHVQSSQSSTMQFSSSTYRNKATHPSQQHFLMLPACCRQTQASRGSDIAALCSAQQQQASPDKWTISSGLHATINGNPSPALLCLQVNRAIAPTHFAGVSSKCRNTISLALNTYSTAKAMTLLQTHLCTHPLDDDKDTLLPTLPHTVTTGGSHYWWWSS